MDESEKRVARLACVLARALECYPGLTWEEALAVGRGPGWTDEFRTYDANTAGVRLGGRVGEAEMRRAGELARGAGAADPLT